MRCIINPKTDPSFNLAAEEYLFSAEKGNCFMLWRNDRAIIVGRNQNTHSQIRPDFVQRHGITVVRRITGGGAVYHDLGNVNFSFIMNAADEPDIDFVAYTRPILDFLNHIGVPARLDGRNDIGLHGLKISGNAQYIRHGRVLHHGTLLFDVDLAMLAAVLQVDPAKYQDKAVQSIRGRVANIREHLAVDMTVETFMQSLQQFLLRSFDAEESRLSAEELVAIRKLARERYGQWAWNYGDSPPYNFRRSTRTAGGTLEIYLKVEEGIIREIRIHGDYFGLEDIAALERLLVGSRHEQGALEHRLAGVVVDDYLKNVGAEELIQAMF